MKDSTDFVLGDLFAGAGEILADTIKNLFAIPASLRGLTRRCVNCMATPHAVFEKRLDILVAPYIPALMEKRCELLTIGAYGEIRTESWSRELGVFMDRILMPRLGQDMEFVQRRLPYVAGRLDDMVVTALRLSPTQKP
jgi:hypothetical protein